MPYGRDKEAAAVDALLAGARAGRSGVLVPRGDAGMGESALLEFAVARAQGGSGTVSAGTGGSEAYPELGVVSRGELAALFP